MLVLVKIFYCLFFGLLDLLINSFLTGSFKVKPFWAIPAIILTLLLTYLHGQEVMYIFMLRPEVFNMMLLFSFLLVFFFFSGKIQDHLARSYGTQKGDISPEFQKTFTDSFIFIRDKLIYVMVFLYQVLYIFYISED
ncbi:hypothetical protein GCM10028774_66110 [Spirosoma jeollabukense]